VHRKHDFADHVTLGEALPSLDGQMTNLLSSPFCKNISFPA
jgi:hypothetical protein